MSSLVSSESPYVAVASEILKFSESFGTMNTSIVSGKYVSVIFMWFSQPRENWFRGKRK